MGVGREGRGERDVVAFGEHFAERGGRIKRFDGAAARPDALDGAPGCERSHAERIRQAGDLRANAAEPDDAHRPPGEEAEAVGRGVQFARDALRDGDAEILCEMEGGGDDHFGDGGRVHVAARGGQADAGAP